MYELGKRGEAEEEGFIYSLGWRGEVLVDSSVSCNSLFQLACQFPTKKDILMTQPKITRNFLLIMDS